MTAWVRFCATCASSHQITRLPTMPAPATKNSTNRWPRLNRISINTSIWKTTFCFPKPCNSRKAHAHNYKLNSLCRSSVLMKKLWLIFLAIFIGSFAILGWVGTEIFRQAPPIPREVITSDGKVLFSGQEIQDGQNVWQAMGGMEMGSIWGHGSYVAPDWTADYLHT